MWLPYCFAALGVFFAYRFGGVNVTKMLSSSASRACVKFVFESGA